MPAELYAVRATAHRITALCGPEAVAAVVAERDGWSRLDRDPREIGRGTRALACVLSLDETPRDGDTRAAETLRVTTYAPDGATGEDAEATVLPGGAGLLRRAITHDDPRYTPRGRLTDACRALGVPPELLIAEAGAAPEGPPPPQTGVVLVAGKAGADAVLTGQSSWTVPLTPRWSLVLWDGAGRPVAPPTAALALTGAGRPAVACWWSARSAGFVVLHGSEPVAGHQWGDPAPVSPESTAEAARILAAGVGGPDQRVALTALLRRKDQAPAAMLASLLELLGLPGSPLGRTDTAGLAAWASAVPGAVHTDRMSGVAAVRHAVRSAPARTALGRLSARRPLWYRLLNGAVAVVMGLATAVLAVVWRGGGISGWWVLAGVLTTLSYAWGLRPRRS